MASIQSRRSAQRRAANEAAQAALDPRPERPTAVWWQRDFYAAFFPAMISGLLLWLALPPVNWTPLAWIAPIGWLWVVMRAAPPGRSGYWALWIAASLHWLAVLEGIRRPYWALHFGWAAMSLYVAAYYVVFVASARMLVHRWRWPIWLAAPVCWTGWELARGHVITGFSGALLAHTQVRWTQLIQIADLFGAYGVSFLIMTVAACLALVVFRCHWKSTVPAVLVSTLLLAATLAYGAYRWQTPPANKPQLKIALLQGTYDTLFEYNPKRTAAMFRQYMGLAHKAALERPDLDLIVWPESTFTEFTPLVIAEKNQSRKFAEIIEQFGTKCRTINGLVQQPIDDGHQRQIQQIVGISVYDYQQTPPANYNSCLLLDDQGQIAGRYDKNHLVMFGEYIPIVNWFPWLYKFTPMPGGASRGQGPQVFSVGGLNLAPSICFETFVPHLIRRQVVQLQNQGTPADVLINITHDGWFWGSAILDLQQACSIFRAVEHRRPLLVAANPGLTTWVDGNGRVLAELPRHREDYLVAQVTADGRATLYQSLGDWPVALCLSLAVLALISGWRRRPARV